MSLNQDVSLSLRNRWPSEKRVQCERRFSACACCKTGTSVSASFHCRTIRDARHRFLLRLLNAGGFQHIARGSMKSRFLLACLLVACLSLNSATAQHVPLGPLNVEQSKLACALAGATRLESAASCVTGRRSNQLNHAPHLDGLRLYGLPIPPDSLLCPPHSFPPLAPWRDRATF